MKLPGISDWPLVSAKSFKHRRSQESHGKHTPPTKKCSKQHHPINYISLYHINYINKTYFTGEHFQLATLRNPFCAFPVASFRSFALGLIWNSRPIRSRQVPMISDPVADFSSHSSLVHFWVDEEKRIPRMLSLWNKRMSFPSWRRLEWPQMTARHHT